MSENTYWEAVRGLVESGHTQGQPKHQIRSEIVNLVEAAYASGEQWAEETLTRWATAGADADYTRVFKDMNAVTYIRADGRRSRKTVAYSRPKRSMVSGEIVGRQMQAWWGMSRAAVEELRREMFAQGQRIDDVIAALDRVIEAMDRHPDCATALEAWEAEGRDVGEIDLSETG
jgi:hypothetical protein